MKRPDDGSACTVVLELVLLPVVLNQYNFYTYMYSLLIAFSVEDMSIGGWLLRDFFEVASMSLLRRTLVRYGRDFLSTETVDETSR